VCVGALKRKTARAINTKLDTHILSACTDPEVKGQGHMVMKTADVAWMLVKCAAAAAGVLLQVICCELC